MQYTFIIIKLVFNLFILLSLYNIIARYKIVGIGQFSNTNFLSTMKKISTYVRLGETSLLLVPKFLILIILKNILLITIVKKTLYYNPYFLVWSLHDLLCFIVYSMTYITIVFLIGNEFGLSCVFDKFIVTKKILEYINNIKAFAVRISVKIFIVLLLSNMMLFMVNFLPHINY